MLLARARGDRISRGHSVEGEACFEDVDLNDVAVGGDSDRRLVKFGEGEIAMPLSYDKVDVHDFPWLMAETKPVGFTYDGIGLDVSPDALAQRRRQLPRDCARARPIEVTNAQRDAGYFGELDPNKPIGDVDKKRLRKPLLPSDVRQVVDTLGQFLKMKTDGQHRTETSIKWLCVEAYRWFDTYDWQSSGYSYVMMRACTMRAMSHCMPVDDLEQLAITACEYYKTGYSKFFKDGQNRMGWFDKWRFAKRSKHVVVRVAEGKMPLEDGWVENLEYALDRTFAALTLGLFEDSDSHDAAADGRAWRHGLESRSDFDGYEVTGKKSWWKKFKGTKKSTCTAHGSGMNHSRYDDAARGVASGYLN